MIVQLFIIAALTFGLGWLMKCNVINVRGRTIFQASLAMIVLVTVEQLSQLVVGAGTFSTVDLLGSYLGVGLGDRAVWLSKKFQNSK